MDLAESANLEVEQIQRLAREALDRRIAVYRTGLFAAVAVLTLTVDRVFFPFSSSVGPAVVYYWGYFAVSIGLWRLARTHAGKDWFAIATILFDLSANSMNHGGFRVIGVILGNGEAMAQNPEVELFFHLVLTGLGLSIVCQVHSLRESTRLAIFAWGVAVLFMAVSTWWVARDADLPQILSGIARRGFSGQTGLLMGPYVMAGGLMIASGFVSMSAARSSRARMLELARVSLLKRMVPSSAVERVSAGEGAVPLTGRSIEVTLMSTDLRGFTAMSERLSPEAVVMQLNDYHSAMLGEIERYGGMLDKFIGDGALIVFGHDGKDADAGAAAAIACARSMLDALARHNADRAVQDRAPLVMGIGIHTGVVVSGPIGAGSRMEMTVIGDAVNTASRLESFTKEAGVAIVISAATAARLPADAGLTELGAATVRGKSEPIRVFGVPPSVLAKLA